MRKAAYRVFASFLKFFLFVIIRSRRELACASNSVQSSKGGLDGCSIVFVNQMALKDKKLKFPLDEHDSSRSGAIHIFPQFQSKDDELKYIFLILPTCRFLVLKKMSEEGAIFLDDPNSAAPAIFSYKVKKSVSNSN